MNCRICNRECKPLFQLDNMPDRNQHLSDKPDTKGITLNVVQCKGCGLVQLDNEPVWYWKESINSARLSSGLIKELVEMGAVKVSFMELEHQPDPNKYLQDFRGDWILVPNHKEMTLYDVCIDHLFYFYNESLRAVLEYNGFLVKEIKTIYNDVIIAAHVKRYKHVAVYGAGHQAFAWLALHPNFKVDWIYDDNTDKVGKYSPVTNIPIVGDVKHYGGWGAVEADAIIVMAGGYSDEVLKKLDDFEGSVAVLRGNKLEVIR